MIILVADKFQVTTSLVDSVGRDTVPLLAQLSAASAISGTFTQTQPSVHTQNHLVISDTYIFSRQLRTFNCRRSDLWMHHVQKCFAAMKPISLCTEKTVCQYLPGVLPHTTAPHVLEPALGTTDLQGLLAKPHSMRSGSICVLNC